MKITVTAPAKVNLSLTVTGRRKNGYHTIASVMAMVDLYDRLTFEPDLSGKLSLTVDSNEVPRDDHNLVMIAAHALKQKFDLPFGAKIALEKEIPIAAGLGGGSADAAATLIGLSRLWDLPLTTEQLVDLGVTLGADVPFFFSSPLSWVTGIGEIVKPLTPTIPLSLLILKPDFGIAAADAYANGNFSFEQPMDSESLIAAAQAGDAPTLATLMTNDLEPWALKTFPPLVPLIHAGTENGALITQMTGSGSAVIALFSDTATRDRAAIVCERLTSFVYPVSTLLTSPVLG